MTRKQMNESLFRSGRSHWPITEDATLLVVIEKPKRDWEIDVSGEQTMNASELIRRLQKDIDAHGDHPVYFCTPAHGAYLPITKTRLIESVDDASGWCFAL
jgi:hypothetical protein